MKLRAVLLSILLLTSIGFAAILESGDAGGVFVEEKAEVLCQEDVQAVYKCLGSVVRAVSNQPEEGSTFYKPDGKVVSCPDVPPSEMGAECLQMMTPNYCPEQAECGESEAPDVFPGLEPAEEPEEIIEEPEIEEEISVPDPEPPVNSGPSIADQAVNTEEIPTATPSFLDSVLDNLALVILLLGAGSLAVLFLMFRNSLQD